MNQLERRLSRLEQRQPAGRQGPGAIFIVGINPVTREETVNTAIIVNGENLHREPGESQRDFRNRVARAGGTNQVTLPEKDR